PGAVRVLEGRELLAAASRRGWEREATCRTLFLDRPALEPISEARVPQLAPLRCDESPALELHETARRGRSLRLLEHHLRRAAVDREVLVLLVDRVVAEDRAPRERIALRPGRELHDLLEERPRAEPPARGRGRQVQSGGAWSGPHPLLDIPRAGHLLDEARYGDGRGLLCFGDAVYERSRENAGAEDRDAKPQLFLLA